MPATVTTVVEHIEGFGEAGKAAFLTLFLDSLTIFFNKRIRRKIPKTLLHDVNDVSDDLDVVKIDKILVECSFFVLAA